MKSENFKLKGNDGKEIIAYRWTPGTSRKIKAAVHIIHGMGEHAGRYKEFASFLTGRGFAVYALDQLGHGKTAGSPHDYGHFDDENGWEKVFGYLISLTKRINNEFKDSGIFLFGHSSGSFLAREHMFLSGYHLKGAVLSSTAASPGTAGILGILLAKYLVRRYGPRVKSPIYLRFTFESYNKYFKPVRTESDWVTRDNKRVDELLKDPYCHRSFTACFYLDLIRALFRINKSVNILKIPKNLPVLFISGTDDPVGGFKKGVTKVYNNFKKAGIKDVELKFYEDARHDLVNELNRYEIFDDAASWLEKRS
jgi:alpha-beta hydrolase superfamily lysophospholipase